MPRDLAHLIRTKQSIGGERLQQQLVLSYVSLLDDRVDPVFAIRERLNQPAFAVGLVPVVAIESIQRDTAPLQNRRGGSADRANMHDDGRTKLDLPDLAQLNGVRESRYQQRLRCRA